MRFDDNEYLLQLEHRLTSRCGEGIAHGYEADGHATVDGTDASDAGDKVEREAAKVIQEAIRGVSCVSRSRVADETRRRTKQRVDVLVLDKDASPAGKGDLPIRSVRVALEIKRSERVDWQGLLGQLASIKSLTRMRPPGESPVVAPGMPTPRGNMFCGALFTCPRLSADSLQVTWEDKIQTLQRIYPNLWRSWEPVEPICDSGRFPNFFWGWGRYVILKCYASGDMAKARPDVYDWSVVGEFKAPSRAASGGEDTVLYYLGRPKSPRVPILQFFRVRFRKEARAFLHDPSDEDRVFDT